MANQLIKSGAFVLDRHVQATNILMIAVDAHLVSKHPLIDHLFGVNKKRKVPKIVTKGRAGQRVRLECN